MEWRNKHIYLCGFMGSGKTTIGRLLADRLKRPFTDTDEQIEKISGQSIPAIFEQYGEPEFRRIEKALVRRIAADNIPSVIALGGGSLMDEESLSVVRATGLLVFLDCSMDRIIERVNPSSRPLFKTERLTDLLNQRLPGYRQASWILDTSHISPEQTTEKLMVWLHEVKSTIEKSL